MSYQHDMLHIVEDQFLMDRESLLLYYTSILKKYSGSGMTNFATKHHNLFMIKI